MNSLLIIASLSLLQPKEAKVYARLEKCHAKNIEKSFELANKYERRDKTLASPYYFQVLYYEQKAKKSRKTADESLAWGNAVSDAVKFEKYADDALLNRTDWSTKKAELRERVIDCLVRLKKEHNTERRRRLTDKAEKLFDDLEIPIKTAPEVETVTEAAPENLPVTETQETQITAVNFVAKPSGKERLPAHNATTEKQLLELINKERIARKLQPLKLDSNLVWAARYHANDMAKEDYFDHDSYNRVNGKLVRVVATFERIRQFYPSFANTENIAAGNSTAQATYTQWFNSPGHNANMFNSTATSVGIGMAHDPSSTYGYYWVFCTGY